MKIGVAGAGAVGSVFGGFLAHAGYDVTFMARGNHLQVMQESGLTLDSTKGTFQVHEKFTHVTTGLSDVDIVLFCFKSNDTKEMALELKRILKSETVIMTLQNGVDNEEILSDVFGKERIISAASYVQALVSSPGQVKQEGRIKLVIGALHESLHDICTQIVDMFHHAKIDIDHVDNIMKHKWRKLLWNVTFNPLSAVLEVRVGEVLDDEQLHAIATSVCEESIKVAHELGISFDMEKTVSTVFQNATFAKKHQTSMLQDRLSGKEMEVESMCGYIVKKGIERQVPTPTLATIYQMLTFINKQITSIH